MVMNLTINNLVTNAAVAVAATAGATLVLGFLLFSVIVCRGLFAVGVANTSESCGSLVVVSPASLCLPPGEVLVVFVLQGLSVGLVFGFLIPSRHFL
jgi:hypothetical protein